MNLLKQPLLAGDSGSGRIRKVAAEDQREARRYEEEKRRRRSVMLRQSEMSTNIQV